MRRLSSLSAQDALLLIHTLGLVLAIRMALLFAPLRRVHAALLRSAPLGLTPTDQEVARLVWAVRAASARVPGATCLPQALALQVRMHRRGARTRLHVGFVKRQDEVVEGHAWLEWRGRVLLGGESAEFSRVLTLDG